MKHDESEKVTENNSSLPLRPKKGLVTMVFLVTLLLLTGFWLRRDGNNQAPAYKAVCNDELLTRSKVSLEPPQPAELSKVAAEIRNLSGYDTDPNCLYVVVNYNLQVSDSESARSNFNKLKDNYQSGKLNEFVFPKDKQDQLLQNLDSQITELNATHAINKNQVIMNVEEQATQ